MTSPSASAGNRRFGYNGNHDEQGFAVTLADTGLNTMTGGRVKRIQKYVQDEPFMLTYGDGVTDLDLGKLLEFHKSHGKLATVTAVTPTSRFGILEMDGSGQVKKFLEKPKTSSFASAGFFIFEPGIFDYLERRRLRPGARTDGASGGRRAAPGLRA